MKTITTLLLAVLLGGPLSADELNDAQAKIAALTQERAQLIAAANAANIRAAKAEGEVLRLKKELAAAALADPFAAAPGGDRSAPFAAPPPPAKPKSWQLVQTLQGTTNKRGPKFTVGDTWRVQWLTTNGEMGQFIASAEGDNYQNIVATQKSGKDITMGAKAGTYSIDVMAYNASWAIKVEEFK